MCPAIYSEYPAESNSFEFNFRHILRVVQSSCKSDLSRVHPMYRYQTVLLRALGICSKEYHGPNPSFDQNP